MTRPTWIVVLLLLVVWTVPAQAYMPSMSNDGQFELWWESPKVTVHLNEDCDPLVDSVFCQASVWNGLATWNEPSCSAFEFIAGGLTRIDKVGYDNINLVVWVSSGWDQLEHHKPKHYGAIALTSVSYRPDSGQILDMDVEFNADNYRFFSFYEDPSIIPANRHDIENVMTHEAGHIVGLDDLYDDAHRESTMFGATVAGERKKVDLDQDDIDGLCYLYPITSIIDQPLDSSTTGCNSNTSQPSDLWFGLIALLLLFRHPNRQTTPI